VATKEKKMSVWIKLYMIILVLFGMSIWFSLQFTQKQKKVPIDIAIDEKIVNVLVSNDILQSDILSQYIMERNIKTSRWNEFYKKIKLKSWKTMQLLERKFRSIARSMKVGLSKVNNRDGSVTYKFYSPSKSYYNITFVR